MKTCPNCNTGNMVEAKFCKQCRHRFEPETAVNEDVVECPQCNAGNPTNKKFCGACGFNLRGEAGQTKASIDEPVDNGLEPMPVTVSIPGAAEIPKVTIKTYKPPLPKVDKSLVVKAYIIRINTAMRSTLVRIARLVKRKPKQQEESVEPVSERSKIKRILVVACVAGATAVAASFGISWLMNDVAAIEAAQLVPAPVKRVQSPPEDTTQPAPTAPIPEVVTPSPIAVSPTTSSANERVVINSNPTTAVEPTNINAAQPVKKKASSNQQDINRQRLLELKRQLGQ